MPSSWTDGGPAVAGGVGLGLDALRRVGRLAGHGRRLLLLAWPGSWPGSWPGPGPAPGRAGRWGCRLGEFLGGLGQGLGGFLAGLGLALHRLLLRLDRLLGVGGGLLQRLLGVAGLLGLAPGAWPGLARVRLGGLGLALAGLGLAGFLALAGVRACRRPA